MLLALSTSVWANPVPAKVLPSEENVYIASEHLVMNVSLTNTSLTGVFTFTAATNPPSKVPVYGGSLDLPIWLPILNLPKVIDQPLQKAIGPESSTRNAKRLQKALGLRFSMSGQRERVGVPRLDNSSFFTRTGAEAGFQTLIFRFVVDPEFLLKRTPLVTISYCQPHLFNGAGPQFYYLPLFSGFGSTSTADTNRYSITVRAAAGCSLAFTNGDQVRIVHAGKSVLCSPSNLQPIRGVVWPDEKEVPQMGTGQIPKEPSVTVVEFPRGDHFFGPTWWVSYQVLQTNEVDPDSLIKVFVGGEVRYPGYLMVPRGTTVLAAIAKAGGFTDFSALKEIKVTQDNKPYRLHPRWQNGQVWYGDGMGDYVLQPGTIIHIARH